MSAEPSRRPLPPLNRQGQINATGPGTLGSQGWETLGLDGGRRQKTEDGVQRDLSQVLLSA